MRKALLINASQAETQGACVGIHAELNALAVFYALNIDVDFSESRLLNCFNNFIKIAIQLSEKLEEKINQPNTECAGSVFPWAANIRWN